MKTLTVAIVMGGLLGGVVLTDATAQSRPTAAAAGTVTRETWSNVDKLHDSRDLIGLRIKNAQGKDIGEIDALMIDPKDGKVTHAVVGVGGFLGVGEKHLVVPWSDVKVSMDHNRMVVTMDQPTLERAPRYERRTARTTRDRTPAASPATTPQTEHKTEPVKK